MTMERERHDDMTVTPLFGADGAVHSSALHLAAHRFRSVCGSLAGDAGVEREGDSCPHWGDRRSVADGDSPNADR
jgi:hypothetical protein